MKNILQYQISDWHQASKCLSNFSPEFRITVSDFIQNSEINGTLISVKHDKYGIVFCALNNPYGDLVDESVTRSLDLTTVLNELERFGFYISWVSDPTVSTSIVDILQSIRNLKFDKLRLVVIHENSKPEVTENYIVAFNIDKLPGWINTNYSPSRSEFTDAIVNGYCLNVSQYDTSNSDWSWIYNGLYDIDEIIESHVDLNE